MTKLVVAILAIANILGFAIVGLDKNQSRQENNPRVREVYFFVWAVFFSSLGVLVGMLIFHHKTRKWYFPLGMFALIIQQALLIYLLLSK